jgi:hypothetical protein
MSAEIHFEIFVKKNRKAGWSFDQALTCRQEALELAKAQLEALPKGSVRVTKESYDESQNSFLTVTIFEDGEERHKQKICADNKMEPTCLSPDDFYAIHTRRTLGRALAPWLKLNGICALELLHRTDLAEKLSAAGHDRQHAIQKVAIAQAGAMECSVQHIVRRLTELADQATDQLRKANAQKRTLKFNKKGFAATLKDLKTCKEPVFALNSALASRLASAKNWPDKLSFLAGCVSDALVESSENNVGLEVLDAFLAEIVSLPHALDSCAQGEELGDRLDRITDIITGKVPLKASDSARLLALAISSQKLPQTQSALAARVFTELRGPRRLYPDRFEDEVTLNRSLADRLVRLPTALVPVEMLSEAFTIRSSRLLEASSIERLLESTQNPGERIITLVTFEKSMVGEHNKYKLATFLRAVIGAHKTELWLAKGGAKILQRLSVCAQAQKQVLRSGFSDEDKLEISTALDRLCYEVMVQNKAFEQIENRDMSALQKAIILLKLPDQNLVTLGKCAEEANRRALKLLRDPQARSALAQNNSDEAEALNSLLRRAKERAA